MFGIGFWELVIIAFVALLVLGPEKLPDVARQLGRGLRELKRTAADLQDSIQEAVYSAEDEQRARDAKPELRPAAGVMPHAEPPADASKEAVATAAEQGGGKPS
jgi:Tat protein translocase TatB subunit